MHEILTIQLGNDANYVGTHFWNAQEAYFTYDDATPSPIDHNIHFRAGIGAGGVDTFTPRALIYDLKGGFGTMRKINELYDETEEGCSTSSKMIWDYPTAIQKEKPLEQIQYQRDLEAGVNTPAPLQLSDIRYWSDYNRVYFHPRSSVQLTEYELDSKLQPFEQYDLGTDLFQQLNREHDILDRDLRLFVEECDQIQGLQIITSADNGWAGFAGEYIEELRDEYGKTAIFTWGLQSTNKVNREKQLVRHISLAKGLSKIVALSSVYIPLANPPMTIPSTIALERNYPWHTSALLTTAIETSTLQTRLRPGNGWLSMNELSSFITHGTGRSLSLLSLGVGCQDQHVGPDSAKLMTKDSIFSCSWRESTHLSRKTHTFSEVRMTRGVEPKLDIANASGSMQDGVPVTSSFHTSLAFPMVDSFPSIFSSSTNTGSDPNSIDTETLLSSNTSVIQHITDLKSLVARAVKVYERETLLNGLDEIVDAFQEGWNSDSDWDDDL